MTQPMSFTSDGDKKFRTSKVRTDSFKGRNYKQNSNSINSRAWSAKNNGKNIPITLNKRKPENQGVAFNENPKTPNDTSKRSKRYRIDAIIKITLKI